MGPPRAHAHASAPARFAQAGARSRRGVTQAADPMRLGRTTARTARALALLVLPGCLGPAGAAAADARPTRLSPANYGVAPLCSAPAPGHSACLGLSLIANTPLSLRGARALAPPRRGAGSASATPATEFKQPLEGLTPADVRAAYGLAAAPPRPPLPAGGAKHAPKGGPLPRREHRRAPARERDL